MPVGPVKWRRSPGAWRFNHGTSPPGAVMNAIKMVSWIHLVWGLSMIVLGVVPRPFGQLEAFLIILDNLGWPVTVLGVVFCLSGLISIVTLRYTYKFRKRPHFVPMALMPQQLLLTVGILFFFEQIFLTGFDARLWYSGCIQVIFGTFHGIGMYHLYRAVIIEAQMLELKSAPNDRG